MTVEDYQNPPQEVAQINKELYQQLKVDYSKFHQKEQAFIKNKPPSNG